MFITIGNYIGNDPFGIGTEGTGGFAPPPFNSSFWESISDQWQNIITTWN